MAPKKLDEETKRQRKKESQERYRKKNREKLREAGRIYRENNKEKILESNKIYRDKNKELIKERNKHRKSDYDKKYYNNHKDKILKSQKEYYDRNNYKINKRRMNIYHNKKKLDIEFMIIKNLRSRMRQTLYLKKNKTIKLIGCSSNFLKKWLEFQFDSNMNWSNYGSYWHIDHVKACSLFNLKIIEEQYKCFNWLNLRPLEAKRNLSKYNHYKPFDTVIQQLKKYFFDNKL